MAAINDNLIKPRFLMTPECRILKLGQRKGMENLQLW